jgi:hypothetical protein
MFLLAVVAIVALLMALGKRSSLRQTLRRAAAQLGGRLEPGAWYGKSHCVRFVHAGNPAELRFLAGGKNRPYTHLEIHWSGPPLRCEVYPEGLMASLGKLMGMEDIVIGSPRFDWQFIITGDDAAAIKSLLNAQVQAVIFNLNSYVSGIHIRFSPRSLTVTSRGHLSDYARLIEFARQCRELYDAAAETQSRGIEFFDGSAAAVSQATATARCMVCGEGLSADVVYCRSCRTPHHRDCWSYSGGCSTYGCRETTFVRS